ncbi:MFS transporter [Staphylospora marina]|uniref:MFS transporter n=1 Tax=Staphylospora marina TaxID=2490858 RepID=UPI000F5BDFC9|nr:MFS transporter [Staphylospora marina]
MKDRYHYLKLLKERNVRLLWYSTTSNLLGDQLHEIALLWLVLQMSGSGNHVALVMLASRTPLFIVGLMGGVYSDRWNKIRTITIVNTICSVLVLTAPVLYIFNMLTVPSLVSLAAVIGIARCFGFPAYSGLIPDFVEKNRLQGLNGLLDTTKRVARSMGPAWGGTLTKIVPVAVLFVIDALSYLLSAVFVKAAKPIHVEPAEETTKTSKKSFAEDLFEVWQYIKKEKSLGLTMIGFGLYNVAYALGYWIGIPSLSKMLGNSPSAYSYLIASFGLGGLIANLTIGKWKMTNKSVVVCIGFAIVGSGFVILGTASNMYWAYAFGFCCAFGLPLMDIAMPAKIQEDTKREMIGRVFSLWRTLAEAGLTTGLLLGSFLNLANHPRVVFISAGIYAICVALVFMGLLKLRTKTPETSTERNVQ